MNSLWRTISIWKELVVIPALIACLLILCLAGNVTAQAKSIFSLIPASTFMQHFYLWNIFTAGLFQLSWLKLLLYTTVLVKFGVPVERLWGAKRLVKFLGVSHVATGVACITLNVASAMLLAGSKRSTDLLFSSHYGSGGIAMAVSVAYALEWPTRKLPCSLAPQPVLTFYAIFTVICTLLLFALLGFAAPDWQLIVLQTYIAWVYLRFFEQHSEGYRGNDDESFALVTCFPTMCHPVLKPIFLFAHKAFNCYGCLSTHESSQFRKLDGQHRSVLTETQKSAERRRLRALRELDAKLAALVDMPDIPLSVDDDDDDDYDDDESFVDQISIVVPDALVNDAFPTSTSGPMAHGSAGHSNEETTTKELAAVGSTEDEAS